MSDFELDPSKLLGQEIRLCVERSRADENEFDEAEEEAIYWLIYDRVRHLGLRKHKMFGHIMLCLMPIAAATDDLDDLDELIQEVAERSEEHTSELQSLMRISYAVFCLKHKTQNKHKLT